MIQKFKTNLLPIYICIKLYIYSKLCIYIKFYTCIKLYIYIKIFHSTNEDPLMQESETNPLLIYCNLNSVSQLNMNLQLMITAQVYFAIFIWPNIYIHVNILIQNYCAMLNKIIMTLEGSRIPMHSLETQKIKKIYTKTLHTRELFILLFSFRSLLA